MNLKELLKIAINTAIKGGHEIMEVYVSDFAVEHKEDKSPLTLADKNCNAVIEADLQKTVPTEKPPTGGAAAYGTGKLAGKGKGKKKKN